MTTEAPEAVPPAQTVELPIKAVLILFLPVSYLGGFLALSAWAMDERLGFLSFSTPRYLAAGIPVALLSLGTWIVARLMDATVPAETMTWRRRLRRVGTEIFAYSVVSLTVVLLYSLFAIKGWNGIVAAFGWIIGLLFFVFLSIMQALLMGALQYIGNHNQSNDSSKKNYVFIQMPTELYQWTKTSGMAAALAFITAILIVSVFLLPSASSSFGGAEPRDAVFAIERDGLTDRQAYDLLQRGNHTGSVHPSVILRVYVETSASYVVEVKNLNDPSPPRYELSKSIVKSVAWIS